jgi:hypothetical protein
MKTKNALGGLLGLFGSFSALVFLTESLQQKQTNSNQNHNPKKTTRLDERGGQIESYLESPPLDLALAFISRPTEPNPTKPSATTIPTPPNSQRFDLDFEIAVPWGRIATRVAGLGVHGTVCRSALL